MSGRELLLKANPKMKQTCENCKWKEPNVKSGTITFAGVCFRYPQKSNRFNYDMACGEFKKSKVNNQIIKIKKYGENKNSRSKIYQPK